MNCPDADSDVPCRVVISDSKALIRAVIPAQVMKK
jgi:hypothetical protein